MRTRLFVAFILGLSLPTLLLVSPPVSAQGTEIERLQQEINNRSNRLSEIDAEIAKFEQELNVVGAEKKTLQSAINRLEVERKKVNAEISRTETLISSTDLEINKLALEINKTEKNINGTKDVIASIIRREYQSGDTSLVEVLLGNEQLSDFWNQLEAHHSI
ncbi:MAG: hypothetical protein KBC35_04645, partial [Candidatus Pacebacteria bacterium]|nr:hypothetical protein [Candidatus Paceibacterota bacterium]